MLPMVGEKLNPGMEQSWSFLQRIQNASVEPVPPHEVVDKHAPALPQARTKGWPLKGVKGMK